MKHPLWLCAIAFKAGNRAKPFRVTSGWRRFTEREKAILAKL